MDPPVHLGGNVWRIGFAPLTEEGDYQYAIGPDVRDLDGRAMDQNRDGGAGDEVLDVYHASFRVDFTPLVINSHSPAGVQHTFVSHVDVTFSEEIDAATLTPADVVLTGPTGLISVLDPVDQGGSTWRFPFSQQQTEGEYTLVVGPDVDDLAGHPMVDAYTGTFEIRLADLSGSDLNVPSVGGSGSPLDIAWRVANEGAVEADALWSDMVYLSDDDAPGGDTLLASFEHLAALDPAEYYDQAVTVTLPQVAEGDYWIMVVVDGGGEVDEPDESDNVLVAGPIIIRRPNLTVGDLQFPSEGSPGQRLEFGCTVSNTGAVPTTGAWYVTAYLSDDDSFGEDENLGTFAAPPSVVAAGERYDRVSNWDIPGVPPGNYYLVVQADRTDLLKESDESDNIAVAGTISIKSLDLVVTDLVLPTGSQSGEEITIRWELSNSGTGTITDNFNDIVYLQNQVTGEFWYKYVGYHQSSSGPIAPGQSVPREATFQLPDGDAGVGEFWVQIETDAWDSFGNDRIYEWNASGDAESNNTWQGTFHATLATYPDLVLNPITVTPENPQTGDALTVRWRLENHGNAPVASAFSDRIRVINTTTGQTLYTDYLPYDPAAEGAIAIGAGVDRQLTLSLPKGSASAGDLEVTVLADWDEDVFERNDSGTAEDNNEASQLITTTLAAYPDLAVVDVDFPQLIVGDPAKATISWTVENLGTGDAPAAWTDVIVVSENNVLGDWDDEELLQLEHVGGLDAGARYQASQQVWLPPRFEGRFHLFVTTDIDDLVFEDASEVNNTLESEKPLDVVMIPYADLVVTSVETPTIALSGQACELTWTVSNLGIGPTNVHDWRDFVYLSHDPLGEDPVYQRVGDSDVLWYATVDHLGQLSSGASYTHTASLTLPEGLEGTVYVVVTTAVMPQAIASYHHVSPYAWVSEFIYTDNNQSVSDALAVELTPPPDLVVTDIDAPEEALEDTLIDVQWTVRNNGAGEATPGWVDRVWLQDATDPDADPIELGTFSYAVPLQPGTAYTRQETVRIAPRIPGTYYVVVTTDRKNELFEHAGEDNNTTIDDVPLLISVKPRPDLQVASITAPATVDPEGSLSAEFVIINQGTVATTTAHWVDRVYLSLDDKFGGNDLLVATVVNQSALAPGESYLSVSAAGTVPRHYRGDMFVLVETDAYHQMDEWPNEGNNILAVPIHVTELPLADLVVSDVVVPAQAIAGSEIEVRFTVTNLARGRQTAIGGRSRSGSPPTRTCRHPRKASTSSTG